MTGIDEPRTDASPVRRRPISAQARSWVNARPLWLRWLATAAVLLVLSTVLVGRYAYGRDAMSRADEYVYIDAVDKAMHGEITRQGASIDVTALDLIACRGIELHGPMGETCGGPYDRSTFPYRGGITSADIHSPVYYFTTAALTKVVQVLTPVDDLLIAARMTGALWLGLGLTAMVWLARTLGASRSSSAAVALLVLSVPAMRWTNAYVTPDSLNLLVGSLIGIAAVKYARGRWSPWVLIGLSAVAAAVKAQNSIASALVALFLVLYAVTVPEIRTWRRVARHLAVGAGAVGAALVVQFGYNTLRAAWAVAPPPIPDTSKPFDPIVAISEVKAFLMGVSMGPDAAFGPALQLARPEVTATLAAWLLAAGLIGAALFATNLETLQQRFAQATALAFVVAGPVFYTLIYAMTHRAFVLPERYGIVMLPAMAVATALVARRRWVQLMIVALAGAGYVVALLTLRLV